MHTQGDCVQGDLVTFTHYSEGNIMAAEVLTFTSEGGVRLKTIQSTTAESECMCM